MNAISSRRRKDTRKLVALGKDVQQRDSVFNVLER